MRERGEANTLWPIIEKDKMTSKIVLHEWYERS